jgi:hypothetical protein
MPAIEDGLEPAVAAHYRFFPANLFRETRFASDNSFPGAAVGDQPRDFFNALRATVR